jgi:hypothetical protein
MYAAIGGTASQMAEQLSPRLENTTVVKNVARIKVVSPWKGGGKGFEKTWNRHEFWQFVSMMSSSTASLGRGS